MILESIHDKIRKLNALAENAGTEAEAANAASKIADICMKHNIDIGSVKLTKEETEATEGREDVGATFELNDVYLEHSVEKLFNVGCYKNAQFDAVRDENGYMKPGKKYFCAVFYGLKSNVASALLTFQYFRASVESLLEGHLRQGERWGAVERRSFRVGCAKRIYEECVKVASVQSQQIAGSTECTAIVHLGNALCQQHAKKLRLRITRAAVHQRTPGQRRLLVRLCGRRSR